MILTRQKVEELIETESGNLNYCKGLTEPEAMELNGKLNDVEKGAYFLIKSEKQNIILIATGSEVELAFKVKPLLKNHSVSIVSMISFELFERQNENYKKTIIDKHCIKISIEAMTTLGWAKYSDLQIGIDEFGRSAPGEDAYKFFDFVPEKIATKIENFIKSQK